MENVLPVSFIRSRTKLDNYNDEKYDQVAVKYLIEKIVKRMSNKNSPHAIKVRR